MYVSFRVNTSDFEKESFGDLFSYTSKNKLQIAGYHVDIQWCGGPTPTRFIVIWFHTSYITIVKFLFDNL